jgi:hypothetical protein
MQNMGWKRKMLIKSKQQILHFKEVLREVLNIHLAAQDMTFFVKRLE